MDVRNINKIEESGRNLFKTAAAPADDRRVVINCNIINITTKIRGINHIFKLLVIDAIEPNAPRKSNNVAINPNVGVFFRKNGTNILPNAPIKTIKDIIPIAKDILL